MNINSAFETKYLAAADLPEDENLDVTIKDVEMGEVGQGTDIKMLPIVYFKEVKKGLCLNKTNSKTIVSLHGAETDDWAGKRISLYATEVEFKGDTVMAIRVRLRAPKKGEAAEKLADSDPFADE